jgi:hypothetical protein
VRGVATNVAPDTGSRVVCYCDDCQAFAKWLGGDGLTDAKGGTDLFQLTPSQLALAWVLHQGDDIVPIPGTKRRAYLEENVAAADVMLSKEELAEIESAFPRDAAHGLRYPEFAMKLVNI